MGSGEPTKLLATNCAASSSVKYSMSGFHLVTSWRASAPTRSFASGVLLRLVSIWKTFTSSGTPSAFWNDSSCQSVQRQGEW